MKEDRSLWSRLSQRTHGLTADSEPRLNGAVGPASRRYQWHGKAGEDAGCGPGGPPHTDMEVETANQSGRTDWCTALGAGDAMKEDRSLWSRLSQRTHGLTTDSEPRLKGTRGFTLLEALVATVIMGIAVSGILSGLAAASRNAGRLTDYDRATLLARHKMDELLVDRTLPRNTPMAGIFDPALVGGGASGWNARIAPFDAVPGSGPGNWVVDRVQLEVWWMSGPTRHSFTLEGFRRGVLQPGESLPGGSAP
jgi:prepilin-type N-terminal cleavage/methylation domain-containing protein